MLAIRRLVGFLFRTVTDASFNTAIGAGTLALNNANENTATGAGALLNNTIGVNNVANGAFALFSNTEGSYNTAAGDQALFSNTTGTVNTAIGAGALFSNTTGYDNTAIGGDFVLFSNTTGGYNTAVGVFALAGNTTGGNNTANGAGALQNNTTGFYNTANGDFALTSNTTGLSNTANGYSALAFNTTSSYNTANGMSALYHSTGSGNIGLGAFAGANVTTANNVICIGTDGNNEDNSCYVGNIFGATSANGVAVLVNSNGRLGTMTSSKRFKEHIKPMDNMSEALYSLKPVSFRYRKEFDSAGTSQLGLVAEDVEKIDPDLVVRDKEGKPYSVRYDQVNAMLLNEFLKEHKASMEEQKRVEQLEAIVASLAATVKEGSANPKSERPGSDEQGGAANGRESIKIGGPTTDDTDCKDIEIRGCPRNTRTTRMKRGLALSVSCSLVCLVGNNRRPNHKLKRRNEQP